MILKATGKKGVPQGGVISPVLSNLHLNEVDRMLERAISFLPGKPAQSRNPTLYHQAEFLQVTPDRIGLWSCGSQMTIMRFSGPMLPCRCLSGIESQRQ